MIKEKQIALSTDKFELFTEKWKLFVSIYDFMGPVCRHLCLQLNSGLAVGLSG